jgi:P-type conjugative transfer protein TrbL
MNATALDTITNAFVDALQGGTNALAIFSIPLLVIFATIAFYVQLGSLVASGSAGVGDALASTLLSCVKTGVFYWLLINLSSIAAAAFDTFLQWGMAAGGTFSAGSFRTPSSLINLGFRAVLPIQEFMDRSAGWVAVWNYGNHFIYTLAKFTVLIAFFLVALHLMMTIIEYNMAVLVGTVLIPWGVLQPTAFFTEFSIGWLTGGLVRVLVTGAIVGVAVPLFDLVAVNTTSGGDPSLYSAVVMAFTSLVFAILAWVVPGRAAAIAGRGVSLALHGGAIIAAASGGLRGVVLAQAAIRGISSLIRRR